MIAQATQEFYFQFSPIVPLQQWWQVLIFFLLLLILGGLAIAMIRRDTQGRSWSFRGSLLFLRLLVLAGLTLFVWNLQFRSSTQITRPSRLAVLVDTSLSMGLKDPLPLGADSSSRSHERRIDEVIESFSSNSTLAELAKQHLVTVYSFGESERPEPIVVLGATREEQNAPAMGREVRPKLWLNILSLGILLAGLYAGWRWLGLIRKSAVEDESSERVGSHSGWLLGAALLTCLGLVLAAASDLIAPQYPWYQWVGVTSEMDDTSEMGNTSAERGGEAKDEVKNDGSISLNQPEGMGQPEEMDQPEEVDWQRWLNPTGTSTKLGSAIQSIVNQERGGPIAGIVVLTDGRSNGGVIPTRAIASASNASIPVFPVGVGSTESPRNIQVVDLQSPPRVFPNDKFRIKALVQAFGLEGQPIKVVLQSVDVREREAAVDEAEATIKLASDGKPSPVEFEVSRRELGKRRYKIVAETIEGELDANDNVRSATVEVIDRKSVVLMIAGGPSREFRFLRNQLFRDEDIELHVWLQSAKSGADQESDVLLTEFPQTRQGVFQYDCMIAFDPDWRELDPVQADLLERWVAEKAGGMLLIAGPVNTPEWTRKSRGDETIDKIRRLYPVSFFNAGSAVLKIGRFGGESAFPLQFTREGRSAEFLWIGDNAVDSAATWDNFDGVFGYYGVNEAKPGADIQAYFSDDSASIDGRLPIYFASHFYGAGRTFFQASSEMWRVRKLDVEYFEQFYLKLIRWLAQGRLLRNSTRGVLLTDRERCWMGDQVKVQAILTDAQDQPYLAQQVLASVTLPNGKQQELKLESMEKAVRPGTFTAQMTTSLEGEYRINLPIPDSPQMEVLSAAVQVNIPDLEKEQPIRNDALLNEIADKTRGYYYAGVSRWDGDVSGPLSPVQLIAPRDQVTNLPGTPDQDFRRKLMAWILLICVVALCLEWTARRLSKLA